MKVQLNLATSPDPREQYALTWAVPVAVGALVVLVYFAVGVRRDIRHYREYHQLLFKLQTDEARWGKSQKSLREELDRPQHQKAFRLAKFVNTLIRKKEFSLAELMENVIKLLPPMVRLDGLAYSPASADQVVRFTVVGKNQDAVQTFVSNLEDSDDFQDVMVLNEGLAEKSGSEATVTCTAVFLGGTER